MRLDVIAVTACNIWVVTENPKIIIAHLLRVNVLTTLFRVETVRRVEIIIDYLWRPFLEFLR